MQIQGTVVAGLRQARQLGYPTANLAYTLEPGSALEHGVYAGTVHWEGETHRAAIVIGGDFRDVHPPKCEAYILDWTGDLYNHHVTFKIGNRVRALRRFDSIEELKEQIEQDIDVIRVQESY